MQKDLGAALAGCDGLVLATRHEEYMKLDPAWIVERAGGPLLVVDAFNLLDDEAIRAYLRLGCTVRGMGRGHIGRIREELS